MDFIIADDKKMEVGFLPSDAQIDLDLNEKSDNRDGMNDGVLTLTGHSVNFGWYLFCSETEYGGRILDLKRETSSSSREWFFDSWRRMLGQIIIEPPEGQAYLTVDGDANAILKQLLAKKYDGFFEVPDRPAGIPIKGQFDRYVSFLDGVGKLFGSFGARLKISAVQGGPGEAFTVLVEAVPIADRSEEIEYSQDQKINLSFRDYRRGINHLICLGTGELTERMVRHLYVQEDGSIGAAKHYTGLEERTAVFDYPNAETEEELLKSGKEKLLEMMNYKKLEMTVKDMELEIGDIIAGRDRESGLYLKKPIVGKVVKLKGGVCTTSYKVKGDD